MTRGTRGTRGARSVLVAFSSIALAGLAPLSWSRPAAAAPHLVKGPYLTGLSADAVDVRFELDSSAPASVVVTPQGGGAAPARTVSDEAASMHVVRVGTLAPATVHTYEVRVGAAAVAKGRFITAPKADSGAPVTFLVYGDDRSDETAHAALARALVSTPSDFLVNTGDIVADGGNLEDWQSFFQVEAGLLRDRAIFLSIGNHELYDDVAGANFARYFGFRDGADGTDRPYGTMRWSGVRLFFLNGMHDWSSGDERQWLERELGRADEEAGLVWRVVVVHHGPWSSGPHGGNAKLLSAHVPELLARHKVDLVLSGHDHIYERGASSGVKYLVSGGGGAPLYSIAHRAPTASKAESAYHYIEITANADAMRIATRRVDGTALDTCGFSKGQAWDCDRPPAPTAAGPAPEQPPTSPETSSRCGCDTPGARLSTGGELALLLGLGLVLRRRG
jgi:hypothetical protein